MKKTIATSMMVLVLNACMTDGGGDQVDTEEEREDLALTPTDLLLQAVTWAGGEAASFVAGEVFGLPMPTEAVDISEETLELIREIVQEEIQDAAFVEYDAKADGALRLFGEYNGVVCDALSQEPTGDCSADNLRFKLDTMSQISSAAVGVYDLYASWHEKSGGTVPTDRSWQVMVVNTVQTMIAIDLATQRETYEIRRLLDEDKAAAWATLNSRASQYSQALDFTASEYDRLVAEFGPVEIVETSNPVLTGYDYQACFNAPGGPDCGGDDVKIHVRCGIDDSYCYEPDPDDPDDTKAQEIIAAAEARLAERKQIFQERVVGNPEQFKAMVEEVRRLSTMAEPAAADGGE